MSSGEEAVFDPDQSTSGYVRSVTVGDTTVTDADFSELRQIGVDMVTAMENLSRNLIAIEAAILGADSTTVTTSINDEPFT